MSEMRRDVEQAIEALRRRDPQHYDWLSLPISPALALYAKELLGLPQDHRLTRQDVLDAIAAERVKFPTFITTATNPKETRP